MLWGKAPNDVERFYDLSCGVTIVSGVIVETDGSVGVVTLSAGDSGNVIDRTFCGDLLDAVHMMAGTRSIRCVLLRGSGRFFCVGGDVRAFAAAPDMAGYVRGLTGSLHMAIARLARLEKPVVTAVNGPAAGAGLGLAIVGDVVIAAQTATFSVAYPAVGLSPDAGVSYLLPRMIGLRRAQEMLFLQRSLTAQEGAAMGLVTSVVADTALDGESRALAQRIAAMPTQVLSRARRLMLQSSHRELEAQLEAEADAIAASAAEPHARAGVDAFVERRRADFT